MAEIRVALVMGGGVSLGSFSAGALIETLRLFDGFAARLPIRIDVATGASAGSMTLAVAIAHLYRGSSLSEVQEALETAWLRAIDFRGLHPDPAQGEREGQPPPSILSDGLIREIAEAALPLDSWDARPPHPLLADGALLSFALSNLNGIPVRAEGQLIRQPHAGGASPTGPKSPFADALQTTLHTDQVRFRMRRAPAPARAPASAPAHPGIRELGPWDTARGAREWRFFREAALASGAFPGAFPPIQLHRTPDEYGDLWPDALTDAGFPFDYVDGGLFRNEPLREAIRLAALQDAARPEGEDGERVFILIDPSVRGTTEAYTLPHNLPVRIERSWREDGTEAGARIVPNAPTDQLLATLRQVAASVSSQATFRDWLKAARVNRQVAWRDELAEILEDLVPREGSDAEGRLDRLLDRLNREARPGRDGSSMPRGDTLAARLALIVDRIAQLETKRKLNLVAITPASLAGGGRVSLAGNFLGNFGGFFEEPFRRHDYAVGRHMAARVLTAPIADGEQQGGAAAEAVPRLIRADAPIPALPVMPDPPPAYGALSPEVREGVEHLFLGQARGILSRLGVPSLLRGAAADRLLRRLRSRLASERPGEVVRLLVEIGGVPGLALGGTGMAGAAKADGTGLIRTLVEVRRVRGPVTAFVVEGPHVSAGSAGHPQLTLVETRRLAGSRVLGAIRLEGEARGWWEAVRVRSVPLLRLSWEGGEVGVVADAVREGSVAVAKPFDG